MSSLYVIRGKDQGRRFELADDVSTIGRDASSQIRLRDTEVSRKHAQIKRLGGQFFLVDLNSSNGTFVNNQKAAEVELRTGDRIQVGRSWLLFTSTVLTQPEADGSVEFVAQAEVDSQSQIVSSIKAQHALAVVPDGSDGAESQHIGSPTVLEVMYRTALAVSHTLDIDELLNRILELIFESVPADRGCIMLSEPDSDRLVTKAVRSRLKGKSNKLEISRTIIDFVLKRHEGVLTSNAGQDDRWESGNSILTQGIREAICVPMRGRYGSVGVIYVDTYVPPLDVLADVQRNRLVAEHLQLLVAIGHQAALAVEDTYFYSSMLQSERLAAVGQTVALLSHHIKNILQGIRGGSFLIEEGLKHNDAEALRKGWSIVDKNQERISNLVLDMLTFTKERKPDLAWHDLQKVVNDVIELMRKRAEDSRVELRIEAQSDSLFVLFDEAGIHRSVLNLIVNAIEACKQNEGGTVQISVRLNPEKTSALISVRDNGVGIPESELDNIFKLFESSKGNRGTGLGLPATQKIVREHGGEITVTSIIGKGSEFTIVLPYQQRDLNTGMHDQTIELP